MKLQLAIFLSVCALAYSYNMVLDMGRTETTPHEFFYHDKNICATKTFNMGFSKSVKESTCSAPRETVVQLIPPSSDVRYHPSAVVVKRCSGMCHKNLACAPSETKMVKIGVRHHVVGENDAKCGVVHVEEHVRCKCMCETKKHHCNAHQEYIPGECMCACMNMEEKIACENNGKLWDQKDCKCICKTKEECTTPYTWVPQYCSCMKVEM